MMRYYRRRKYTDQQVVAEGVEFLHTDGGVPVLAAKLNMPKSTVYYHVAKRLSWIDEPLWHMVRDRIDYNKHNRRRK